MYDGLQRNGGNGRKTTCRAGRKTFVSGISLHEFLHVQQMRGTVRKRPCGPGGRTSRGRCRRAPSCARRPARKWRKCMGYLMRGPGFFQGKCEGGPHAGRAGDSPRPRFVQVFPALFIGVSKRPPWILKNMRKSHERTETAWALSVESSFQTVQ